MLGRARRPLASLCMVALALDVGGCTRVRRRETGAVIRPGESGQVRERIVGATRAVLHPAGAFLVYQVTRAVLPDLRATFGAVRETFEPRNLPPARLFFCRG